MSPRPRPAWGRVEGPGVRGRKRRGPGHGRSQGCGSRGLVQGVQSTEGGDKAIAGFGEVLEGVHDATAKVPPFLRIVELRGGAAGLAAGNGRELSPRPPRWAGIGGEERVLHSG